MVEPEEDPTVLKGEESGNEKRDVEPSIATPIV